MMPLEAALVEISSALDRLQVPHMLVGDAGCFAVGGPENLTGAVTQIARKFDPLPASPTAFVAQRRGLPVSTTQGVRADLIFVELPYGREAIGRSQQKQVGDGMDDASRILRRFRCQIDYAYLEPRLRELADAPGRSEIIDLFQRESGRG